MWDDKRLLFVCGAQRSGTTMMKNLLNHRKYVLQFPVEDRVADTFFTGRWTAYADYWAQRFITDRQEGGQAILGSASNFERHREKMRANYGNDFVLSIEHERFLESYRASLPASIERARDVYLALMKGLAAGNRAATVIADSAPYFLFKSPGAMHVHARALYREDGRSKFIHIIRHPFTAYASAKGVRLVDCRNTQRKLIHRENGMDPVCGLLAYSLHSYIYALDNRRAIGDENYLVVRYEDLLADPESVMRRVCKFLDVPFDKEFLVPVSLSGRSDSGSAFTSDNDQLRTSAARDFDNFLEVTSQSERSLIKHRLIGTAAEQFYDIQDWGSARASVLDWIRPLKNEGWKLYLWRQVNGKRMFSSADDYQAHLYRKLTGLYADGRVTR